MAWSLGEHGDPGGWGHWRLRRPVPGGRGCVLRAYRKVHTPPQQCSVFNGGMTTAHHPPRRSADQGRTMILDSDSVRGVDRRRMLKWGGAAAAGVPLVSAGIGTADWLPAGSSGHDRTPPDTLPGGAYDRYVAQLAAEGKFSG